MPVGNNSKYTQGLCSVICTTYNHANYSRAAIESIIRQDFNPIEIIIIDDGSNDKNIDIIRAATKESGINYKLLTQKNTGNVAMNANRAIKEASGEYLILTSLDDILLPGCISAKIKMMKYDPDLVIVGNSTYDEIDSIGNIIRIGCQNPIYGKENWSAAELLEVEFSNIHSYFLQGTAIRTDFMSMIGGFEEGFFGDDLILRTKIWKNLIVHPELRFLFLPHSGFAYRKHTESIHRRAFRQIRTVIDWSNHYFPGRPLPDLAQRWVRGYINQCLDNSDDKALDELISLDPKTKIIFESYSKTLKYRIRSIRRIIDRTL